MVRGFLLAVMALSAGSSAADAPPWAPIIGKWRAADYGSCGIDDTRFGRITSVTAEALLTDKIFCAIQNGATSETGYTMEAICEVGMNYYAVLTYDWRLISDTEAALTQDGYERRLIRCEGEHE